MQLNEKQFKNFIPAHEEGRAASDWLSTSSGHRWQTIKSRHGRASANNFYEGSHRSFNMFTLKDDDHGEGWEQETAYNTQDPQHYRFEGD